MHENFNQSMYSDICRQHRPFFPARDRPIPWIHDAEVAAIAMSETSHMFKQGKVQLAYRFYPWKVRSAATLLAAGVLLGGITCRRALSQPLYTFSLSLSVLPELCCWVR
jgi:hypothetical protein